MELDNEQQFAFAAIASMCLVSFAPYGQSENELEEIYIQIHQAQRLDNVTEFSLQALDELKGRLDLDYYDAQSSIISEISRFDLDHDERVEIINMALDVVKSNKVVSPEKIDVVSGLCRAFNLYTDQFNFVT